MLIRVPVSYTYKNYRYSTLATKFDKFCHSPIGIGVRFLLLSILTIYWYMSAEAMGLPKEIYSTLIIILFLIGLILTFFLGSICDKLRWSDKLAAWDIKRRATGQGLSRKAKGIIAAVIVLLLLPGVVGGASEVVRQVQATQYHTAMVVLDGEEAPPVTGTAVVSLNTGSGQYSTEYVPEKLQARTPEEAAYILRCTHGEELEGYYGDLSIYAYRRYVTVELVDRASGRVLDSETFYGGGAPNSISEDTRSDQYGSWPDEEEVAAWVDSVYAGLGTKR